MALFSDVKKIKGGKFFYVLPVLVLLIVGAMVFTGSVEAACRSGYREVKGTFAVKQKIDYDQITDVRLIDEVEPGERGFGASMISTRCGTFENSAYGEYLLYMYKDAGAFVQVTYGEEGKILVVGLKTQEETKALCETLSQQVEKAKAQ